MMTAAPPQHTTQSQAALQSVGAPTGPKVHEMIAGVTIAKGDGDPPGIHLKNSVILFGKKFFVGLALCGIIVCWALSTAAPNEDGFKTGAMVVLGGIVGVMFTPSPKPVDHTVAATTSVERMMDVAREISAVQSTVSDVITTVEPLTAVRLIGAQDSLLRQQEDVERSIGDWNEVSPGVVTAVAEKREAGRKRFLELTKEHTHG